MNNTKDIKPANRDKQGKFKPGYSGNPSGRPAGSLRFWLVQYLEAKEKGHDKNRMQELAEKIAIEAFKGDKLLMKEVFDRVDGKSPETIRHEGEVDMGIQQLSETLMKIMRDS